jgi:hypothetical protein
MNPASNTLKWTKVGLTLVQVCVWPADGPHRALYRDFCSLSSRWLTNHMNCRLEAPEPSAAALCHHVVPMSSCDWRQRQKQRQVASWPLDWTQPAHLGDC